MKPKRNEAKEQEVVVHYCIIKRIPLFSVPNGGSRNKIEAANLKRQGLKAGVPDLMIPVAKHGYHGLFIEMKVGYNKPTEKQVKWITLLRKNGYFVEVCYGANEAISVIDKYIYGIEEGSE